MARSLSLPLPFSFGASIGVSSLQSQTHPHLASSVPSLLLVPSLPCSLLPRCRELHWTDRKLTHSLATTTNKSDPSYRFAAVRSLSPPSLLPRSLGSSFGQPLSLPPLTILQSLFEQLSTRAFSTPKASSSIVDHPLGSCHRVSSFHPPLYLCRSTSILVHHSIHPSIKPSF